jgi:SAM-dependent methyltransferase
MSEYQDYGYQNDLPDHTFTYLGDILLRLLENNKDRCILDLGCGNGYLTSYLIGKGYNAYGTDASEKGIAIAKKAYPGRFFVQDLSANDLPAKLRAITFDTIISTEVIEHLYDPVKFIHICRDLLPPGGELIISTPYHGYLKNLLISLLDKWDDHINPLWPGGHIKFWSKKTLFQLLGQGGFKPVIFKGCGRVPFFWKSMMIKAQRI